MKRLIIIPVMMFGIYVNSNAQILKNISKQIEKKAEKIVDQKVNEVLDGKTNKSNSTSATYEKKKKTGPFKNIPNLEFDYVRGTQTVFTDDFSNETVGNMAKKWTSNGRGSVVELPSYEEKWLQLYDANTYKIKDLIKIPENFTIEFDVLTFSEHKNKFDLDFGFDYEKGIGKHYYLAEQNPVNIKASYQFNKIQFNSIEVSPKKHSEVEVNMSYFANDIMKVKIKVMGDRMSTYINNYKILDTEMMDPATKKYFYFAYTSEDKEATLYISNFRIDKF